MATVGRGTPGAGGTGGSGAVDPNLPAVETEAALLADSCNEQKDTKTCQSDHQYRNDCRQRYHCFFLTGRFYAAGHGGLRRHSIWRQVGRRSRP